MALTVSVTNGAGSNGAVLDDPDDTALLRDEDPSVRRHGHRRRIDEPAGDHGLAEALTQRRGG